MAKELPIPTNIYTDPNTAEIVRIWATQGGSQHFILNPCVWEDPAAWGLLLVDMARHISKGYAQTLGQNPQDALSRIKEGFDAEWNSTTE